MQPSRPSLDPTAILSQAWELVQKHMGLLIGATFVTGLCIAPLLYLPIVLLLTKTVAPNSYEYVLVQIVVQVINLPIMAYLVSGLYNLVLTAARGRDPSFGVLFAGRGFLSFLAWNGLFSLPGLGALAVKLVGCLLDVPTLIVLGTLLTFVVLVPMSYLGLVWSQTPFLILERKLGLFDAFRESARMTQGQRVNLFLTLLLSAVVFMGGFFVCCVGGLVTSPIFYASLALIYVYFAPESAQAEGQAAWSSPA